MPTVGPGSTSQSIDFVLRKSADNTADTGKVAATLTIKYYRQGASAVVDDTANLNNLAALNTAYTSSGVKEIGDGSYRYDPPDAAFASGAAWVEFHMSASDSFVFIERYDLKADAPTAATIATTVWEDLTTGGDFGTTDSIGKLLVTDIDAAISSRLATSGYTAPPSAATIATQVWTDPLASSDFSTASSIGKLLKDDIDAAVSTRLATSGYTAPPTAAQNATAVWQDTTVSSDFSIAGSIGLLLKTDVDAAISTRLATSGYTAPPTTTQISAAVWEDTTAGGHFGTAGSIGLLLATDIDAAISTRLATSGYTAPPSAATIATAVWEDTTAGGDFGTAGSIGLLLKTNIDASISSISGAHIANSGTAQGGGPSTITLATSANSTDNYYKGCLVRTTGGTGAGQARTILSGVGSTRVQTVDWGWIVQPDSTTTYEVVATDNPALNSALAISTTIAAGGITTASFASGTTIPRCTLVDTLTTYTGNTPQTGDSFALIGTAGAGLTALAPASTALSTAQWTNARAAKLDFLTGDAYARIGANGSGLTALAPASTALSTVQWTNARATNLDNLDATISSRSTYAGGAVASVTGNVGGNVTGSIGSLATQAKTDVENATWDAVSASHTTSGSTGAKLATAAAAGDPLATAVPGSYSPGTAGYVLGTNLDAKVSLTAPASTALSTAQWTNTRAGLLDHLDANVSSRSTYAGGAVASVTAPVTVGTNNDKTGYALSSAGVDAIQVEDGNLRQVISVIFCAAAAGKITLAGTATPTVRNRADTADILVLAGADSAGNRTGSTINYPL